MGFGLGVSVIDAPEKLSFFGLGAKGAFGWAGAFGTWWQAEPANDLILIYLIQNSVPLVRSFRRYDSASRLLILHERCCAE
jgi:CubicO group peptidase (beta-lactamase class C family)